MVTTRKWVPLLATLLAALLAACAGPGDRGGNAPGPRAPAALPSNRWDRPAGLPPAVPSAAHAEPEPPATPSAPTKVPRELPPGFVDVSFDYDNPATLRVACGRFQIENVLEDLQAFEPFVRVFDETGKKVYEAHGRAYAVGEPKEPKVRMSLLADVCGDLTGDGIPEILLVERTMGAHCCYTHYAVSLTSPPKRLFMWDKGDGGHGVLPAKLRPGAGWQLVSRDIVFPPFNPERGDPAVSYASAPSYPIVFELVNGEYVKRTFRFGPALRTMRAEARDACKQDPDFCGGELLEWGYGLILGDWEAQKRTLVTDAELLAALDRRSVAMKALLRKHLGG
jgi:hypothetical protein